MTTTTIRNASHNHVTIRRTGCSVSVESPSCGVLAHATCATVAAARDMERNTIRTWRSAA